MSTDITPLMDDLSTLEGGMITGVRCVVQTIDDGHGGTRRVEIPVLTVTMYPDEVEYGVALVRDATGVEGGWAEVRRME